MAFRLLLVILLVLTFPGMFLHHVCGDCGDDPGCPLCHQAQYTTAEQAPPQAGPAPDGASHGPATLPVSPAHFFEGVLEISPRAPPTSSVQRNPASKDLY